MSALAWPHSITHALSLAARRVLKVATARHDAFGTCTCFAVRWCANGHVQPPLSRTLSGNRWPAWCLRGDMRQAWSAVGRHRLGATTRHHCGVVGLQCRHDGHVPLQPALSAFPSSHCAQLECQHPCNGHDRGARVSGAAAKHMGARSMQHPGRSSAGKPRSVKACSCSRHGSSTISQSAWQRGQGRLSSRRPATCGAPVHRKSGTLEISSVTLSAAGCRGGLCTPHTASLSCPGRCLVSPCNRSNLGATVGRLGTLNTCCSPQMQRSRGRAQSGTSTALRASAASPEPTPSSTAPSASPMPSSASSESGSESSSPSSNSLAEMGIYSYRLITTYDGTAYSGWQLQPKAVTVQAVMEHALSTLLRESRNKLKVGSAGRTDRGVHALGQVVHFYSDNPHLQSPSTLYKLNRLLPFDVRVKAIYRTAPDFNATITAIGKTYHYYIDCRPEHDPMTFRYRLHYPRTLNLVAMREAAALLVGTHDFTQFSNLVKAAQKRNPVKTLHRADIVDVEEGVLRIEFQGSGFLYKQVRHMTGVLLAVGEGKMQVSQVQSLLDIGNSQETGAGGLWRGYKVAVAKGLLLHHVEYPPEADDPGHLLYPDVEHDEYGRCLDVSLETLGRTLNED